MAVQHYSLVAVRQWFVSIMIVAFLASAAWSVEPKQKVASPETTADRLVKAALESELAGNNARRETLLRQALSDSPNHASAHWQLGDVCIDGVWQSPAEVEQAARQDERWTEYRRLRDTAKQRVDDQTALARWCRKNRLNDQQQVHWRSVLQIQPDNPEAIRALGLRLYRGMLLTPTQIEQQKTQQQMVSKATKQWRSLVGQWRRAMQGDNSAIPPAVQDQISDIDDAAEMVALEGELWRQVAARRKTQLYHDMTLALMQALAENPLPVASESLTRYAAFSEFPDVRAAANAGLKRRPLDHYVPLLLSGLQSPIEASVNFGLSVNGDLVARYSVFQEGALANVSATLMMSPVYSALESAPVNVSVAQGTGNVEFSNPRGEEILLRTDPGRVAAAYAQAKADAAAIPALVANAKAANAVAAAANYQRNVQKARAQAVSSEAAMHDAVNRANRAIEQRNNQIIAVLSQATGLEIGDHPRAWWTWWWEDYNDMYHVTGRSDRPKPEYHRDSYTKYRGSDPTYLPQTTVGNGAITLVAPHSCFAPGTKVWTLTGRTPIEQIKVGDRVLSQDVESGELAYKSVLALTTRKAGQWMKLNLGTESITATPSHPFWVAGQGWRMTKQIEAGHRVHSQSGGMLVESVEILDNDPHNITVDNIPADIAYNLIVAENHTYFVGETGMLSHDNTPRVPTAAILPGLLGQPVSATDKAKQDSQ